MPNNGDDGVKCSPFQFFRGNERSFPLAIFQKEIGILLTVFHCFVLPRANNTERRSLKNCPPFIVHAASIAQRTTMFLSNVPTNFTRENISNLVAL